MLEHFRTLLRAQLIPGPESELLDSLDAANPRGQLGTRQASGGGFVSQATHGCKLLVDGVGGQMPRFQVHAIAHDYDAIEGQSWLGAVPRDELVDGILVNAARGGESEHGSFSSRGAIMEQKLAKVDPVSGEGTISTRAEQKQVEERQAIG